MIQQKVRKAGERDTALHHKPVGGFYKMPDVQIITPPPPEIRLFKSSCFLCHFGKLNAGLRGEKRPVPDNKAKSIFEGYFIKGSMYGHCMVIEYRH